MTTFDPPQFHVPPCPHAAVGVRPFVLAGQLRLAIIVKVGLDLSQPIARVLGPSPITITDRYAHDRVVGSLSDASDLALRKQACDVTMTAVARTVGGQPAQTLPVRLALYRGNKPLLSKAVLAAGPQNESGGIRPIAAMPLTYERAWGGPEVATNPVGSPKPSVHLPRDAAAPGSFGPISAVWPVRRKRLDAAVRQQLGETVPNVSAAIDWTYFQAAPQDQQIGPLVGGEWLLIDGISERWARIQTQLPVLDAHAFVISKKQSNTVLSVPLTWDTLAIDGETVRARAVLRGDIASPLSLSEARDLAIVVRFGAGAAELADRATFFSDDNLTSALSSAPSVSLSTTKGLSDSDHDSAAKKPIAPYAVGHHAEEPSQLAAIGQSAAITTPGAPWSATPSAHVVPANARNVTVPLNIADLRPPEAPPAMVEPARIPLRHSDPVTPAPAHHPAASFQLGAAGLRSVPERVHVYSQPETAPSPQAIMSMGASPGGASIGAAKKEPTRLEIAEAALRKSGMSEERLAEVLRDLQREIGST